MNGNTLLMTTENACVYAFKPRTPRDTGNLRHNATRVIMVDENTTKIYVDAAIAPYVVYTNEPWISPYWKGKKNPNQWWFEAATLAVAQYIATTLGGTLTVGEDVEKTKEAQTLDYRVNRAAKDDVYNAYYNGRYRERSYVNAIRQSNT